MELRLDPVFYPKVWADVPWTGRLRFLQVATIAAYPYRWDPSLRGIDWAGLHINELASERSLAALARPDQEHHWIATNLGLKNL